MTQQSTPTKTCRKCGDSKPVDDFYRDKTYAEGFQSACKQCVRQKARDWRLANHDRSIAYGKQWRAENQQRIAVTRSAWRVANAEADRESRRAWAAANPEKMRQYSKDWARRNPELVRARRQRWYEENRAEILAKSRERAHRDTERNRQRQRLWREANPEKNRANTQRYRASKRGAQSYTITEKDIRRIESRQRGGCVYCRERFGAGRRATIEHVLPLSRGGAHGIGNIALACIPCNCAKKDRTVMEWRLGQR